MARSSVLKVSASVRSLSAAPDRRCEAVFNSPSCGYIHCIHDPGQGRRPRRQLLRLIDVRYTPTEPVYSIQLNNLHPHWCASLIGHHTITPNIPNRVSRHQHSCPWSPHLMAHPLRASVFVAPVTLCMVINSSFDRLRHSTLTFTSSVRMSRSHPSDLSFAVAFQAFTNS